MNQSMSAHRGVLILILGILGLVICQLIGPVAWIMGKNDLAEMEAGRMDPEGRGLTQAGWICGIIATFLLVISIVGAILFLVLGLGAAAVDSGSY